jgi:hypothetical protein
MIYVIELAVHLDIDVAHAINQKLEHNRTKYSVEKVNNKKSGDKFYIAQN